jgi:very-short-patch-repair endonuclease
MAGGAQSMGEVDVERMCRAHALESPDRQVRRRDAAGAWRYTDCEWELDNGRLVILEVDGGFHMEVERGQAEIARARALASPDRIIVRCTTAELRDNATAVADDLRRLGVPHRSPAC